VGADRWHDGSGYDLYVGRWSRRVAERFLPWISVDRGGAWIDVGCGTGVLARAILDLEDPETVLGVDPSPGFLARAKTLVRDPRVNFEEGTAAEIPAADRSVDAVVGGLVLNFVPDLGAALQEMRRVARSGAPIGGYVWDYAGEMQMMRRFWDAAIALDPGAATLDEGSRFSICHPEALEAAFRDGGLEDVEITDIEVPTLFRDFDDYWTPFLSGVAPAPGYVLSLDDEARRRLRDRLDWTLPREPDGSIDLIARAWAVQGRA